MKFSQRIKSLEDGMAQAIGIRTIERIERAEDDQTKMDIAFELLSKNPLIFQNMDIHAQVRLVFALPLECQDAIRRGLERQTGEL